ncbi:hypothetical protein VINI7043_17639 [Vibrio nigripulchritudo ATCC 27043]|uniref:hypothetical protein n=1 Tax=Vibrio nigripulchritudo TaxID=28173 RepID=UPI00021C18A4|nr:hypothetical protein [Vibrio nigripulchritudo]EGU56698.1 hypothetical protein VINI7043_17639 [Vibrio nigripulchritudo ATCC 27043]
MDKHLWQNKFLKNYLDAEEVTLFERGINEDDISNFTKQFKYITDVKFNGFNVGQDIYFSKLRNSKVGRYSLDIYRYRKEIKQFLSRYMAMNEILDKNNINCLLISDIAYTSFLPVFIASLNKNINTIVSFPYGKTGKIGGRSYVSQSDYNNVVRRFPFSFNESTWSKAQAIDCLAIEEFVSRRFEGRTELFDGGYQKDKCSGIRSMNMKENRFIALVACHLVWDNPGYESLFNDYIDWLIQTLKVAEKRNDVNWIVKSHPSEKHLGTNEQVATILNDVFDGDIPQNIYFLDSDTDVSTFQLIEEVDFIVTCRGTITFEAASLGKKVVTAGDGPHTGLGIAEEFSSATEYITYLEGVKDFSFDNMDVAKRAMYTYMEVKAAQSSVLKSYFDNTVSMKEIRDSGLSDKALEMVHNLLLKNESKDIVSCCSKS